MVQTSRSESTTIDQYGNKTTKIHEETIDDNGQRHVSDRTVTESANGQQNQSQIEGENEDSAAPATGNSGGSSNPDSAQRGGLDAHNRARDRQGLPHLVWDDELAEKARQVAENCLRVKGLVHSPQNVLYPGNDINLWNGENLSYSGGEFGPNHNFLVDAVDAWMSEERAFREGRRQDAGHYTQVMWRKTKKVGMAVINQGRDHYVAARYWPAGNINNEAPF